MRSRDLPGKKRLPPVLKLLKSKLQTDLQTGTLFLSTLIPKQIFLGIFLFWQDRALRTFIKFNTRSKIISLSFISWRKKKTFTRRKFPDPLLMKKTGLLRFLY